MMCLTAISWNGYSGTDDPCADLIIGHYEQLENHRLCRISITEEGIQSTAQLASLFMKYQYRTGYFGYLWNKLIRREIIQQNARYFEENLTLAKISNFSSLCTVSGSGY